MGDGDSRTIKIRKDSMIMLIVKGISILISLAYVPLMLNAVNRTDYGILLTLTSIVNWIAYLDLGIGNGLRNKVTEFIALGENDKAREAVSSCYAMVTLYSLVIVVIFILVAPYMSWCSILNSPESNEIELLRLATIVFISFCLQFILSLTISILYAFQMPIWTSIINLISQTTSFLAVIILVTTSKESSLLMVGSITCVVPPLVLLIASILLFRGRLKIVSPSFQYINLKIVNKMLGLGVQFFILQATTVIFVQTNNIIITQAVNPATVVEYNVVNKFIGILLMFFSIITAPIWSAVTNAYVNSDFNWIKKTMKYMRIVSFLLFGVGTLMVALSKWIYELWLQNSGMHIPIMTTVLMFIYVVFEIKYRTYCTIINGTGRLFAQMIISSILAILYIPAAYYSGCKWGLYGILVTNIVVFAINYIWAKVQYNKLMDGTNSRFWLK